MEAIDGIESAVESLPGTYALLTGHCIKYLWRWYHKKGIEDLKKARWYLDRLIAKVEES